MPLTRTICLNMSGLIDREIARLRLRNRWRARQGKIQVRRRAG